MRLRIITFAFMKSIFKSLFYLFVSGNLLILSIGCTKDYVKYEPTQVPLDTTTVGGIDVNDLKINEIQTLGSHNSYRIMTYEPLYQFILGLAPLLPPEYNPEEWNYTHEPLTEQFNTYGMRSIEIDIQHDPDGGRFYYRKGNNYIGESDTSGIPELLNPGMKVIHLADFDYNTHHYTFIDALTTVKNWSDANPNHLPMIIMIEPKEQSVKEALPTEDLTTVLPFTKAAVDSIDLEIETVFGAGADKVIIPDDVRGSYTTLNEAVLNGSWPTLGDSRGKVLFVMMGSSEERANYLQDHATLTGRYMFIFSDPGLPEAAFLKYDDPVANQDTIKKLVALG